MQPEYNKLAIRIPGVSETNRGFLPLILYLLNANLGSAE